MIAGNHDSGYRIEQVQPLLTKFNAKAVGIVGRTADNALDLDRLLVPIYDQQQEIIAWCLTLPYLRSAEITGINEHTHNSQNAISYLHQQLIAEAKARKQPHQALILMSHAHMQGGETSDSERPIIVGNEEALSTALFDEVIDYVALGHLHKPQKSVSRISAIVAPRFPYPLVRSTIRIRSLKSESILSKMLNSVFSLKR